MLCGQIDDVTVGHWRATHPQAPRVRSIDAREVTFLDARGLGLLLQFARVADPDLLTLRVGGRHVTSVLDLANLTWFFQLVQA